MVEELNFPSKSLQAFCESVAKSYMLDLKKDNEKLNNMSLEVVKRTENSIEFVGPDLLVKFDSLNFVLNVIPTRASEALTMECTLN